MKNCLKCGQQIPVLITIDGKERNLQRRKYCTDCSPFNGKNTLKLHLLGSKDDFPTSNPTKVGKTFICIVCDKPFLYKGKADTTKTCAVCINKATRRKKKRKCIEYKGGKCEKCGYCKSDRALSFHHKDPFLKEFQISGHLTNGWLKLQKELDKCILICANCHMELHDQIL